MKNGWPRWHKRISAKKHPKVPSPPFSVVLRIDPFENSPRKSHVGNRTWDFHLCFKGKSSKNHPPPFFRLKRCEVFGWFRCFFFVRSVRGCFVNESRQDGAAKFSTMGLQRQILVVFFHRGFEGCLEKWGPSKWRETSGDSSFFFWCSKFATKPCRNWNLPHMAERYFTM